MFTLFSAQWNSNYHSFLACLFFFKIGQLSFYWPFSEFNSRHVQLLLFLVTFSLEVTVDRRYISKHIEVGEVFLRQDAFLVMLSHHCCPFSLLSSIPIAPKLELSVLFFSAEFAVQKEIHILCMSHQGRKLLKISL